ncbi:MAG: TraR/DksA C4-type zinc finger protein [Solirubrobacterales bacterium]
MKRALEKLDEGTYGVCDVCGEPIASERLEAISWAVRCVRDAAAR